jgi:hypothetical protein
MTEGARRLAAASLLVSTLVLLSPAGAGAATAGPAASSSLAALVLPAVGPGYAVLSQGPIDPATFASSAPNSSAVSSALANLSGRVSSYQRTWTDTDRFNAVQDMLFHFPDTGSARIFLHSTQDTLKSARVESSGPLPGVPGAYRVTYFGNVAGVGVGQAITLRVGEDVVLLSFFSESASGNDDPITQADATEVTVAQDKALRTASAAKASDTSRPSGTVGVLVFAVIAALVLGLLVAVVALVRRRRARGGLPHGSPT